LYHKVSNSLDDSRFMPPGGSKPVLKVAAVLGMDDETRAALDRLLHLAATRKVAVAGRFLPDRGVSARLARAGVTECVEEADFARFRQVVIPPCGISARQRRQWDAHEGIIEDMTAAKVRRAQVALGLLKMESAQPLVIGRHEDPETAAIAGAAQGALVIENTTDTARLAFAPAFGAVCQTTLSPRKTEWLAQQLRMRYRDARVTFLDTTHPMMRAREEALEKLLVNCGQVVVVGDAGEASCEALAETATRRGRTAVIVSGPEALDPTAFPNGDRVALTAGAFATDEAVRAVADRLARG
jgi:4-hydroxy-3-methylbut-2-enyl diphosphate reductase IspH